MQLVCLQIGLDTMMRVLPCRYFGTAVLIVLMYGKERETLLSSL